MTLIDQAVIEQLDSFEALADAARAVSLDMDAGRWTLGDIANKVERSYGENMIGKLAAELRMENAGTLRDYARTAKAFTPALRNRFSEAPLSFSHFRTAAAAETPELAEYWVAQAADNLWAVAELRRQMGKTKTGQLLYNGRGTFHLSLSPSGYSYVMLEGDVSALANNQKVTVKIYAEAE